MKNISIAVVDYDCGNIHSATKALELAMKDSIVKGSINLTKDPDEIIKSDKIVLPGVGAFDACIKKLTGIDGLKESLDEAVLVKAKPILGICIGLQLMASSGFEGGKCNGLNWIQGEVIPLEPRDVNLKVPHMGWNSIDIRKDHPVFNDIESSDYYFVHSYKFSPLDKETIISLTNYGEDFPSSLCKGNILGTQFHPEKSQVSGVNFLKNFIEWSP